MLPDLRTLDQKVTADIAGLTERVVSVQTELARHKQTIARLMERQDKMERMFAQMTQIQGTMALRQMDDDLEMDTSAVAVYVPEEMDDE